MTVNDYLKNFFSVNEGFWGDISGANFPKERWLPECRPRIVCKDGFTFSVQASYATYCTPRKTLWPDSWGEGYSSVEVGFPSRKEELLMPYCEDERKPTKTVYGYVPVEVVDAIIEKHGGMKETKNETDRCR